MTGVCPALAVLLSGTTGWGCSRPQKTRFFSREKENLSRPLAQAGPAARRLAKSWILYWNLADCDPEELQRPRTYSLTSPRSQDRVSTQAGFALQNSQWDLLKPL
jgi:hypothetical protein